ncbi:MAG: hypothetical protein E2598_05625 [Sphingobium sp.]|nr:hypothetical protein [Sphingobium sp.]
MKKSLALVGLLPLALMTSGCDTYVQKLCEADAKTKLINPETAKFYDFAKIGTSPYYSLRVRSEDRLGNIITQTPTCIISEAKDKCSCIMLRS